MCTNHFIVGIQHIRDFGVPIVAFAGGRRNHIAACRVRSDDGCNLLEVFGIC